MTTKPTLKSISFAAGATSGTPLTLDVPAILLLVGPNNSGKSLAIKELNSWLSEIHQVTEYKIVSNVTCDLPLDIVEIESCLQNLLGKSNDAAWFIRKGHPAATFDYHELPKSLFRNTTNYQFYDNNVRKYLIEPFKILLSRDNLFNIVSIEKQAARFDVPATNILHLLQTNTEAIEEVRKYVHSALGKFLVIDPTGVSNLTASLADELPVDRMEEFSLSSEAINYFAKTTKLSDVGDGYKIYCAAIITCAALNYRLTLVDEPDAFLHPPLIRRLARDMSKLVIENGGNLIVATHSADFVIGCLETTTEVGIIRLTHNSQKASVLSLPQTEIKKLMNDPLTRTIGPLRGLFHETVVIGEGDSDRAFYEEINRRLNTMGKGPVDCLFLNATSWSNVFRLVEPLRRLGIPAAGIVDLDVFANEDSWVTRNFYNVLSIPESEHDRLENRRRHIGTAFRASVDPSASGAKPYRERGIEAYPNIRNEIENLIEELSVFGLFVVHVGDLQGWLKHLITQQTKKSDWLPAIFSALGDDPSLSSYQHPIDQDVWRFMERIGEWTSNADRKGMPT